MFVNKPFYFVIAVLLCISFSSSFGQTKAAPDTVILRKHAFVLHLGGGFSSYIAVVRLRPIGLAGSINRSSVAGTVRLMWYPNHRLRFGIETGYTNFYSYNVKNGNIPGRVSLNAIPILFVWSMPVIKRVNVYAGIGTFILNTHLDYAGEVRSKDVVLGSNFALSYTQPLSKKLGLAVEGKWMNAFESRDEALSLQVQMIWRFLEW